MPSKSLFSKLPFDIIREILLFDIHFVLRNNNTLIFINKIPKSDFRFKLYDNISKIYSLASNIWFVSIGKNNKYILQHSLRPTTLIWEYNLLVFSKDPHTNIICSIPDLNFFFS
jgi:hypothetical protein